MRVPVFPECPPRAHRQTLSETFSGWDEPPESAEVDAFLKDIGLGDCSDDANADAFAVSSVEMEFDSQWTLRWEPPVETGERDALAHVPGVTPPFSGRSDSASRSRRESPSKR